MKLLNEENNLIKIIQEIFNKQKNIELLPPFVDKKEIEHVSKAIKKKSISTYGNYTSIFEKKISKITKCKYVVALNSGTSALQLAINAVGIKKNNEVLIPALNFIASTNATIYNNAIPHFIEVDNSLNIDTSKLENYLLKISKLKKNKCINKKTKREIKAIIPTHVFGHIGNMDKLLKICKKFKLKLIEDSSEAFGSYFKKKHAGSFGLVGVFSFNGNKIITTGAGGAIVTNSKSIANRVRYLSTTAKIKSKNKIIHNEVGYNYRMPSLNAALGIAQLNKFKLIRRSKVKLFEDYKLKFKKNDNIKIISNPKNSLSNFWLNAVKVNKIDADKLFKISNLYNIQIKKIWSLINNGKNYSKFPKMNLSVSKKLSESIICIPSGNRKK